jgi:hypothetical protein
VDVWEARKGGGGAFGVGDEGEVAGKELAGETGDWGFSRCARMAVAAGRLRPTRMMWACLWMKRSQRLGELVGGCRSTPIVMLLMGSINRPINAKTRAE